MTDLVPIRRVLISLSDKTGLDELAAGLVRHDIELYSTGGTAFDKASPQRRETLLSNAPGIFADAASAGRSRWNGLATACPLSRSSDVIDPSNWTSDATVPVQPV